MVAHIPEILDRLEVAYGRARYIARFEPMEELISCILSQHTADANSFPAFTRFRAAFPDWEDAVQAGAEGIADSIRKAGLTKQKSKNIIATLIEIHRRTGRYSLDSLRTMPQAEARAWLISLPGVGPKTAAIVLSLAMGRPAIPVDTHVFRLCNRLGLLPKQTDEAKAHIVLEEWVSPEDALRFHSLLIQHGRHTCRALKPLCGQCAVRDLCTWPQSQGGVIG